MVVIKTVEIIDADDKALHEFETEIKKRKFKAYQVGSRLLFEFGDTEEQNETFLEVLEDYAFDLNLDYAKTKLVFLNPETGQIEESKESMDRFALENGLENKEDGVPVSALPELLDFVSENDEMIDSEVSTKFEFEEETEDAFIDDVSSDEELENVDLTTEENDYVQSELKEKASIEPVLEKENYKDKTTDGELGQEISYPEDKTDYLLEKAIALFDSQKHIRLPKFDELTHKELQEQVIDAQFRVAKARDKGIDEIYQRLKAETNDATETVEAHAIKQARQAHEETITRIERNLSVDISKLIEESDNQYDKDREKFVQAQIPLLRKKYDAENYENYQSVLSTEIDNLKARCDKEIAEETARFSEYVDRVFNHTKEEAITKVRLDDIIADYNKIAEEQKELLKFQAKSLQGQIGSTLTEIVKERDTLVEKLEDTKAEIEKQKQSEGERIEKNVEQVITEEKRKLSEETKAKIFEAEQKEKELKNQIDKLTATVAELTEENESLQREVITPATGAELPQNNLNKTNESTVKVKTNSFSKLKFGLGGVVAGTFIVLSIGGLVVLNDIKQELTKSNYLDQSAYLAQIEADGKLERAELKMREFGYKDSSIAKMYLENGDYVQALKTDSSILPDFYNFVDKQEKERRIEILTNTRNSELVNDKQMNGVKVRLAVLDEDTETVKALTEDTDDLTAEVAVNYLINKKAFDDAEKILKVHNNEKQYETLKTAKTADVKEKVDATNAEIEDLKKKIDDSSKKSEALAKQLEDIKKSKDKDKDKKASDKQKELDTNNKAKGDLENQLKEKETYLSELDI
ncbi:TPA: hypothetical protein QFM54_001855 [Enterococcus faecium]